MSYLSYYQSSQFLTTCPSSGYSYQNEVYWFLYDPASLGESYDLDWLPTEMTQGLPFVFKSAEGIELEHVRILSSGSANSYSLTVERPSLTPYKNVSIYDMMGNVIAIRGSGSFYFEDLSVKSDSTPWVWGDGISITGKANVFIDGLSMSTGQSGSAITANGYQVSLSLLNCHIEPRSYYQRAIYAWYIDSVKIENFSYSYIPVDGAPQYYHPIEIYYTTQSLSVNRSFIECSYLSSSAYAIYIYGYYAASTVIHDTSLMGNSMIGGFVYVNQGVGSVAFEYNTMMGGVVYDAVNIYCDNLLAQGNVISHVTSLRNLWVTTGGSNVTANNNSITNATAQDSVVELGGSWIYFQENKLIDLQGSAAIKLGSNVGHLNLTRNALINVTAQFYIQTVQQYDYSTNRIIRIGPNFWSTVSFYELNKDTYDSTYNAALVTIEFESIFIDSAMTQTILSPPSLAILDLENMTLGGTLSDGATVVVPRGLYYASGSIILRHPEAQLVLGPGVRIIFAEYASIRVDRGVLKVLGDMDDPVVLSPTQNFTSYFGNSPIEYSTVFDGLYFGPNSNGTVLGEGNKYIDGSILRHCTINFGGYHSNSASIYLDQVSVMLEKVTILGDWSRAVYGVYAYYLQDPLLFNEVSVKSAGYDGLYIMYAHGGITLSHIDIQGCRNNGITIFYSGSTYVHGSTFDGNGGVQVYVYSGMRSLNVSSV